MTKNNTSSAYQGKSDIVKLTYMYAAYGIAIPPVHLRCNITPGGRILNPKSEQNPLVKTGIWDPVSTSAMISNSSTTTLALIVWAISHTKGLGL